MDTTLQVSLQYNCGYARCAIRELTTKDRNIAVDKRTRMSEFQDLFGDCPNYGILPSHFIEQSSTHSPLFNRHCDKIIQGWNKNWHPPENRQTYEKTFSTRNWKALCVEDKRKHTLSCCRECCIAHQQLQASFPLKPCYSNEPLVSVNLQQLEELGKKKGTRTALATLNESFNKTFQTNFVDTLLAHGEERLQVLNRMHVHHPFPSPLISAPPPTDTITQRLIHNKV